MSIILKKGDVESLQARLKKVSARAGWDVNPGKDLDGDLSVIQENGLPVYFGHKTGEPGIIHNGDNLTGAGEGDDEVIDIDLDAVTSNKLTIVFNIYDAAGRNQTLADLKNAFVRLVNKETGDEVLKTDFTAENAGTGNTALALASLYKESEVWKFKSLLEAKKADLTELNTQFGGK